MEWALRSNDAVDHSFQGMLGAIFETRRNILLESGKAVFKFKFLHLAISSMCIWNGLLAWVVDHEGDPETKVPFTERMGFLSYRWVSD